MVCSNVLGLKHYIKVQATVLAPTRTPVGLKLGSSVTQDLSMYTKNEPSVQRRQFLDPEEFLNAPLMTFNLFF